MSYISYHIGVHDKLPACRNDWYGLTLAILHSTFGKHAQARWLLLSDSSHLGCGWQTWPRASGWPQTTEAGRAYPCCTMQWRYPIGATRKHLRQDVAACLAVALAQGAGGICRENIGSCRDIHRQLVGSAGDR